VAIATAGGATSLLTVTLTETVAALPAVSVARAETVCAPFATAVVVQVHDQLAVPPAGCQAPPSIETATLATATLSAAVPVSTAEPVSVLPDAGLVIVTVGGVVSGQDLRQEGAVLASAGKAGSAAQSRNNNALRMRGIRRGIGSPIETRPRTVLRAMLEQC
jgi:hypothetical protein